MGYKLEDPHLKGTVFSPICSFCIHLDLGAAGKGDRRCKAFNDIPGEIWLGDNNHEKPYEGDGGIQFKRAE